MHTETGKFQRILLAFILVLFTLIGVAQPVLAGDDEKPVVNGKNSRIQFSGVGWVVYRYLLADEVNATAPKGFLSSTGVDRQDANSFDLDRVQLTGDYLFNDRLTWRTVLEGDNLGGAARLYVKNAFFRAKDPFGLPNTAFKFGLYGHAMTSTIDDLWGYRLVSENSINRYLGVGSAYAGVGVETKLAKGVVDLDLGIANELAYGAAAADGKANRSKYKTLMGRVVLTPPGEDPILKSFHLALFGQTNAKNPLSPDASYLPVEAVAKSASDNQNLWFAAMPYFKNSKLALGFEFGMLSNKTTRQLKPTSDPADTTHTAMIYHPIEKLDAIKSRYVGGVITYQIVPKMGCFARVDMYDPDTDNDGSWSGTESAPAAIKSLMVTNVIAGISHSYATGVRSIIDVEYTKFENPKNKVGGAELTLDPDITISARMELKL